jgi:hypothetical protein
VFSCKCYEIVDLLGNAVHTPPSVCKIMSHLKQKEFTLQMPFMKYRYIRRRAYLALNGD